MKNACPTPCDPDCDADCHSGHYVWWKKDHPDGQCGVGIRVDACGLAEAARPMPEQDRDDHDLLLDLIRRGEPIPVGEYVLRRTIGLSE